MHIIWTIIIGFIAGVIAKLRLHSWFAGRHLRTGAPAASKCFGESHFVATAAGGAPATPNTDQPSRLVEGSPM
jgi:hypothetical protein